MRALREDAAMPETTWTETLRIARDHPALPGHFPERPVVPGVVLLDRVAAAIERQSAMRIAGLPQVKFLSPLLPDQDALLTLAASGESIRFHITHNGEAIANGIATLAAAARA